jgi:outer membrane protein assembly factor BamB
MWGRSPSRNAVSDQTGIPHQWDLDTKRNIKWVAPLGTQTYGSPVVAGGKVYVSTNNGGEFRPHSKGDRGCLLCLDAATGRLLWQATHEKLPSGPANDWPEQGVASTPYVEGDRVYYVSNRCELVCADADGFLDGQNDGPFNAEKFTEPQDADFVWVLDMIGELGVFPHNLAACSPVGAGDLIFVCTGNGVDEEHEKPPAPQAPSFIAVDKRTGRVVWKRSDPGDRILHGQWSSPAWGVIGGRPQVVFGGGDGWCYSFDPSTGDPIWRFDLNPKDAVWKIGGAGTKSSIVSTPVICGDRVFLAVGDDPESGTGPGHLYAIDATSSGDITEIGRVWHVGGKDFGRTIASVAIADGLLYAVDFDGYLSCFDVRTGQRHWRYDMQAAVWGSPCVVDGKVLLGNTDGELVVLRHGRELKELARNDMRHPIYTTPAVADGVLYVATQRFLYAIQSSADPPEVQP